MKRLTGSHTENCELDSEGGGNVATALKGAAQNFSEKNVWDQNNTRPQKNIWKPLGWTSFLSSTANYLIWGGGYKF